MRLFLLSDGPPKLPKDWLRYVNRPNSEAELAAWRRSVPRGQPYGDGRRLQATARRLGLESTLRNRGRPQGG